MFVAEHDRCDVTVGGLGGRKIRVRHLPAPGQARKNTVFERSAVYQMPGVDASPLTEPVDAPDALLDPEGIPGQFERDDEPAVFLEIESFPGGIGGDQRPDVPAVGDLNHGASGFDSTGAPLGNAVPLVSGPIGGAFGFVFSSTLGGFPFSAALSLLSSKGYSRTLAEPTLVTMSGKPATFLAGGEFPVPLPQSLGQIGVEYRKFGIQLSFTPTVSGNDISLDLGAASGGKAVEPALDFGAGGPDSVSPIDASDPLARKLELAEEFRQIGDMEGARDLLEEVVAKAGGALKTKAQSMLDSLA